MAFNTKETEIIKWGLANGKSKEQVTQALTNFRLGIVTPKTEPKEEGAISRAFKGGIDQTKEGYNQAREAKNPLELIEGSVKMGAGIINTAFSPLALAIEPTIGKAVEFVSDKISDTPAVQKFANSKAGEITSRITEDVANLNTIAGAVAGGMKVPEAKSVIISKTKGAIDSVSDSVKNIIPKPKPPASPLETAIKDSTPNYETSTPTARGKLLSRVEEGGILKGRTVKPDKLNIEAGTELSKVPGYEPSATKLSKYQVTKAEIAKRGESLESSLKGEKVIVSKKEIISKVQKALDKLPNESLLLQKSDPVIANYMRVFKNALKKQPGNLYGILKLKKILDDAYENARGKQAFGSDKISALDDINKASRDVLTQYLIENAKNTKVKLSLKSQWDLYRALDELKTAAEKESGSSIGRLMQNNPLTTKIVETGVKAAGFGAGIGIIK